MDDKFYYDREQSQVKHRILERYLQAFAPIIGNSYDEIVYVDCLAGPWESRDADLSDTSFHTALSVFRECKRRGRCKHVRALLIEEKPESYARLQAYAEKIDDIEVETQNWDFNEHVGDVVKFPKRSRRKSFAFFFIDPTGWTEARIDRIRPILQVQPGEVLINFMTSWIKRFLDDPRKPFQELLGEDVHRLRTLEGDELEDELVATYASLVRKAGAFEFTCAVPILMPDRDAIHYHLVYGTRGFKGLEEFKKSEAVAIPYMHERRAKAQQRREEENSGQAFLLAPLDTYKETRFKTFNERRKESAKHAVLELLQTRGTCTYKELFGESMQFATVVQSDLREWLEMWKVQGLISYLNWNSRQRVPQPETRVKFKRSN
jgi:three-Cys-motif partner protein